MSDTLFIINPISGHIEKDGIVAELKRRGYDAVLTEYAGHAERLAARASQSVVVAVGGDGTVNEVARGLYGSGKTFGIIPRGSGDGLARTLGISHNFQKALQTIEKGRTHKLDCGQIDGHFFFSVCGVGLDAIVAERFSKCPERGLKTYIREAVNAWKVFEPEEYEIVIDGRSHKKSDVLITVANSRQWGSGAQIAPLASVSDGLLEVVEIDMFHSAEIPLLACGLMTGILNRSHHFSCHEGREITIRRTKEGPAHFDGDYFMAGKEISIRLMPLQLDILVP